MQSAERRVKNVETTNSSFCVLHSAFCIQPLVACCRRRLPNMRLSLLTLIIATFALAQPNPDTLAKHAIDAQSGTAWEKARYFSFSFDVDRNGTRAASFPQRWDRYTGDYRVSGRDKEGRDFIVVMNTNTKR